MPSQIAWLDASIDEQRRMRDIIQLFSDRASLDDLGLGQIRDAISDGLFPGTSTLLTRARYALFIPWCFQLAASHRNPAAQADKLERDLIEPLRATDPKFGLIGAQAGRNVKNVPSTLYRSFLRHYGILTDPTAGKGNSTIRSKAPLWLGTEGDSSSRSDVWAPTLPSMPDGFPQVVPRGFAMTQEEAEWLRERFLEKAPDSLLSHFAYYRPSDDAEFPWDDPAAANASDDVKDLLKHAQYFSVVMHGAQLLYNLLLEERYKELGFDSSDTGESDDDTTDGYRSALAWWQTERLASLNLSTWDLDDLFTRCGLIHGSRVNPLTRRFVTDWFELVRDTRGSLANNPAARALVANRELQHKDLKSARLQNPRRLQVWSGASGAYALSFRWSQVRGVLLDIHDGLESTTTTEELRNA